MRREGQSNENELWLMCRQKLLRRCEGGGSKSERGCDVAENPTLVRLQNLGNSPRISNADLARGNF